MNTEIENNISEAYLLMNAQKVILKRINSPLLYPAMIELLAEENKKYDAKAVQHYVKGEDKKGSYYDSLANLNDRTIELLKTKINDDSIRCLSCE